MVDNPAGMIESDCYQEVTPNETALSKKPLTSPHTAQIRRQIFRCGNEAWRRRAQILDFLVCFWFFFAPDHIEFPENGGQPRHAQVALRPHCATPRIGLHRFLKSRNWSDG
jgi:hypothetical protein